MREVYYFQTYHQKENVHSSNALLLLKRLYYYKSRAFYGVIAKWFACDLDEILPNFSTQEKGKVKEKGMESILDFTISQGGFRLFVEAKEKDNSFNEDQMARHLKNLKAENDYCRKIMITLAPKFSEKDKKLFLKLKTSYCGINIINITYLDIYNTIKDELEERRDEEMLEILEEYRNYCNEEGLIDDTDGVAMVRLAGDTIDFNVREDVNLYFDGIGTNHKIDGFRYIALYNNKCIKYVGKIEKVLDNDGNLLLDYTGTNKVTSEDLERLKKGKEELLSKYNTTDQHSFYLVEKFFEINNFKKTSKYALYGKKKLYLKDYGLKPNCSAEEVAKAWEDMQF